MSCTVMDYSERIYNNKNLQNPHNAVLDVTRIYQDFASVALDIDERVTVTLYCVENQLFTSHACHEQQKVQMNPERRFGDSHGGEWVDVKTPWKAIVDKCS